MHKCPYCGNDAMSSWQKFNTALLRSHPCASCGKRVGPHQAAWALFILVFILFLGFRPLRGMSVPWALAGTSGVIVALWLVYVFALPLVRRDT
jgi:uncharacterized protein (DUF983 family)